MADTLTTALRILARDIDCEDGVATTVIRQAADEIERLRLTDEEREAVEYYVGTGGPDAVDATLRGLLERLK